MSQRLNNLWSFRKSQFEDVLPPNVSACALLRHIHEMCDAASDGKVLHERMRIALYSIRLFDAPKPITVLRRVDDLGLADLRRVDAQHSVEEVLHKAISSASQSFGMVVGRKEPQKRKLLKRLRHFWKDGRRQEFEAEFSAYQTLDPQILPSRFLLHLSALCDKAGHAQRIAEKPPIDQFVIHPPGIDAPITVLRRLDELGLADLRKLSHYPDKASLLDKMHACAAASSAKALDPIAISNDREVKKRLKSGWKGLRREEFESVAGTIGEIGPSGCHFLLRLSAECDRAGGGKVMDASMGIETFTIKPEGATGSITVMRRMDALGLADLRLVSEKQTPQQVLLEMQRSTWRSQSMLKRSRATDGASTSGTRAPTAKRIKVEPHTAPSKTPVLVQRDLDMARTAWLKEVECCDLVGDTAQWSVTLSETDAVIVRHPMQPDPAKDDEFPLRDPHHPQRVHPRYATDDGRCHPQVQVLKVVASRDMRRYMRNLSESDSFGRLKMNPRALRMAFKAIESDVEQELKRLMANQPHPQPRHQTRELSPQDLEPHEGLLIGQQGLFALKYPGTPEPTFRNGRILGLFSGAMLETEREHVEQQQRFPDMDDYALDVARLTLSPLGHANSMAFANTALDPHAQGLAYAYDKINAVFLPFTVTLRDRHGQPMRQPMAAVVALDNLFAPGRMSAQVRLDYGDAYLSRLAEKINAAAATATAPPHVQVKVESSV